MGVLNPFKSRPFEIKSIGHAKKLLKIGAYEAKIGKETYIIHNRIEACAAWFGMWFLNSQKCGKMMFDGFIIK